MFTALSRSLSVIALLLMCVTAGVAAAAAHRHAALPHDQKIHGNPKAPELLSKPGMGVPIRTCVAPMRDGTSRADVLSGKVSLACNADQKSLGSGDFWAVGRIPPHVDRERLRVRISSLWQDGLALNVVYADGYIARYARSSRSISQHLQLGAILQFDIPERASPATALLWEIRGSPNARGILLGQSLLDRDWSERSNLRMAALYSAFAGLAIALLVYHAAMWGALRHRFQLAYCVMVAMLLVYAASSSGGLAWLIPGIDNNDRIRVNYVTLGFAASAALIFARTFFEERVFSGWLHHGTLAAAALVALSGVGFAFMSHVDMKVGDTFFVWSFLGGLLIVAPILWRAWIERSDFLWLFALAWAAPIAFAFARIFAAISYQPTNFWLDNSTVISMTAEALLSSLAIAYRVHTLSRERDAAIVRETIARRLADTDVLTGLLNRRAFLNAAVGRAGCHVLHIVDVDHFKRVNETLGHDGGDEVLRVIARVLRQAVPADGLVARIGGEEFAVLMPESIPLDPEAILARLRSSRMPFDLDVTASIGTCEGPIGSDLEWKALYHCADRALFAAKSAGRDRARAGPVNVAA